MKNLYEELKQTPTRNERLSHRRMFQSKTI